MKRQLELSAAYARLTLQTQHVAPSDILGGTGLEAGDLTDLEYIDWQVLAAMYRNLNHHLSSPAWAARMGARFHITAHGPLGFAALSAPTLGDALDVMATLYPVRNNAIGVDVEQCEGRYSLTLRDLTGDAQFHRLMGELVLQVLESLLSTILGHPVSANVIVSFAYPAPEYLSELEEIFNGQLQFSAEHFSI
ncbi:MAG: AraC family transcriptional regulator ligand-binding domain-containing protein [Halioglobus sp.]